MIITFLILFPLNNKVVSLLFTVVVFCNPKKFTVVNDLQVDGNTDLNGNLDVSGSFIHSGSIDIKGNVTVDGDISAQIATFDTAAWLQGWKLIRSKVTFPTENVSAREAYVRIDIRNRFSA